MITQNKIDDLEARERILTNLLKEYTFRNHYRKMAIAEGELELVQIKLSELRQVQLLQNPDT